MRPIHQCCKNILAGLLLFAGLASAHTTQPFLGELLIVGFRGTSITKDDPIIRDINRHHIGGVILFDYDTPTKTYQRNILSPTQTKQLIADLKNYADHPIWVAVDCEGGKVNRLKPGYGFEGTDVPAAADIAHLPPEEAYQHYLGLAKALKRLGFNLNFAPVVDVAVNPDNPVIARHGRSFGGDPEVVAQYAEQFVRAHEVHHVATTLKHFPGHGSSHTDSHLDSVDITNTFQEAKELAPYRALIAAHAAPMVMTGHLLNKHWDPDHLTTYSRIALHDHLRKKLHFSGIIVSDDLHMQAAASGRTPGDCAVMALQAGSELLIFSNNAPGQPYDEGLIEEVMGRIHRAWSNHELSKSGITHALNKLEKAKERYVMDPSPIPTHTTPVAPSAVQ